MKIFGREPTLWISVIASILSLIAGFGLDWLSPEQAATVVVVLNAALGVVNAILVRPIAPPAFTYFVAAVATLIATYGVEVSQSTIGAVNAIVLAALSLLTRAQVAPKDPVPAGAQVRGGTPL